MVIQQIIVLFHDIGNFCRCQALRENLGLGLHFLHEIRVFINDFANFTLQVCPNFLLVLNYVLSFVKLGFQIVNLGLKFRDLIILILLEVC